MDTHLQTGDFVRSIYHSQYHHECFHYVVLGEMKNTNIKNAYIVFCLESKKICNRILECGIGVKVDKLA